MHRSRIGPLALLLTLTVTASAQGALPSSVADIRAAQEVLALEELWLQSEKTNRPELAEPLMAEDFHATGIDGRVIDKAQDIATTPVKYLSAENFDMQTSVFGTTVIVRGAHASKGLDATGKPFELSYRFTDTWVKMPNGRWLCVASHSSLLR